MFKYLCVFLVLSSPLYAYTFDNYFNFKTESDSKGNSYRVATKEIDGTNFKTYVEVGLSNAQTSCVLIAFGATTQATWSGADILAITLRPSGGLLSTSSIVEVSDLLGGSGVNNINKAADRQDWSLVSNSVLDKSATFSSGVWKIEAKRQYKKTEGDSNYDVKMPGSSGVQPVAINVFPNACPAGAFSYGSLAAIVGGWSLDQLQPTKSNHSIMAAFTWIALAAALFFTN